MPVAIAGMHRSGTSMVARLLNHCGVYMGQKEDLIPAAADNPEGFWENDKFQRINEEILTIFGGGWDMPPVFENGWESSARLVDVSQSASLLIKEISQEPVWGWKDPRNSLTLPFWKKLIPKLKIIVCLRNPFDVYQSLTRRGYSSSIFSYNLWLRYHQQLIISTSPDERLITHYDAFFHDPKAELHRLLNFLELEVSDAVIKSASRIISNNLRHTQSTINDLYATNPPPKLLDLYKELCIQSGNLYGSYLSPEENAFPRRVMPHEEIYSMDTKNDTHRALENIENPNSEREKLQQEIVRLQVEKAREIAELRTKTARLRNELNQILASRSWRLIQVAQKIRLFFVPLGSAREQAFKGIFNFLSLTSASKLISNLYATGIRRRLVGVRDRLSAGVNKPLDTSGGNVSKIYESMLMAAENQPGNEYVPLAVTPFPASESLVKLIAFYLPQFHPIPENDEWWGKGFVEWTNVSKAVPQFVGHYQPHLPGELGFYDLRVPEVQKRQIELARLYGIYGFAFHYYWFNGKRLLEKPLDLFLKSDEDFPFCVCWANENWTRRWDGQENEILIAQEHSPDIDLRFIQDLAPVLRDKRYIKIDGRPLLIVYRADIIPDIKQLVKLWREYCVNSGIGDLYLVAAQTFWFTDPREFGFDATVEFPPHQAALTTINHRLQFTNPDYAGKVVDYKDIVDKITLAANSEYKVFKTVFPGWDNEARKPGNGYTFAFSTPELYKEWLFQVAKTTLQEPDPDKRLLFINAWNEWGEGAHLEPDRKYGYAYLQATMDGLMEVAGKKTRKSKMVVDARFKSATTTQPKVICIHHRLVGLTSHQFNESHGFMQEFNRRGKEFLLLISIRASKQIAAELHAHAVLDDPTFRLEWSFDGRSQRFLDMLHAQIDADLNADDCVLITVATQLEMHALTHWLQELPQDKKPWIVILIISDRWNRSGREEYERQIAEFRLLREAIESLTPEDAHRLIFFTLTDLLAKELGDLLGVKLDVVPMPIEYGDPTILSQAKPDHRLPRVAILGGTRREKGSYLIPDIIRACRSHVPVEFLVHLTNNTLTADEVEELGQISKEPDVKVIDKPISLPEYNAALNSADIALFPYEIIPYRKRTSGVFAEAVAFGKPVIAPRGTWMVEQIEAGHAAGVIIEVLQPDSIAQAIADCVVNLKQLQESAQVLSVEWRAKTGLAVFVDRMEEQIALRNKFSLKNRTPDCTFVLSVEAGKLEAQAFLLVESLRQFGGAYSNCPVYAISPRPSRQMGGACRAALTALGVNVIIEDLLNSDESYGSVARLAACAWAEKNLTSEILVSLDNDLFFAGEPDFTLKDVDFFARPVDAKGICSSGTGDPMDDYWRKIAQSASVDYDDIPWVETTFERVSVKASYNGGMVAVRRELGLFQRAEEILHILQKNDLSPYKAGENRIFASTGFVGEESSRWWGTSQVVLSLAATQLKARISIAPETYNVPAHIAEGLGGRISLKDAVLVHYHWLLDKEYVKQDTIIYDGLALPLPVFQWLKSRTPLTELISI